MQSTKAFISLEETQGEISHRDLRIVMCITAKLKEIHYYQPIVCYGRAF